MNSIVAPSLLAADFRNLEKEIAIINDSPAQWIHFDVMDGNNVPNISFGFPILKAVRSLTEKYIDAHLMIQEPMRYFQEFKNAGANGVTIPIENITYDMNEAISSAKDMGLAIGLALNPDTHISAVYPYIDNLDLVLIMSVFPGFGGQKFIESTFKKISDMKAYIRENNLSTRVEVDGGVSKENALKLRESGADILVSGSALFQAPDFDSYVRDLF